MPICDPDGSIGRSRVQDADLIDDSLEDGRTLEWQPELRGVVERAELAGTLRDRDGPLVGVLLVPGQVATVSKVLPTDGRRP